MSRRVYAPEVVRVRPRRRCGGSLSEAKPAPPTAAAMRALGYVLDLDNRWVHPRLGLLAPDPEALLALDRAQVTAFHAPDTWLEPRELPEPDPLPPELLRLVAELDLRWQFWAGAWESPGGALLDRPALERLGPEGLRAAAVRHRAWAEARRRRHRATVLGMGVMCVWALVGWVGGAALWLGGMVLIAGLTWRVRPLPEPEDLWRADGDPQRVQRALERGRDALGPGWEELAEGVAAASADGERLALIHLGLAARASTLHTRFTPAGLTAVLEHLLPLPEATE